MPESALKDQMARAIAAVIHRSLGEGGEDPKHAVLGDRRRVAEDAADAAIATIELDDTFGDGLIVVRRTAVSGLVTHGDHIKAGMR